MYLEQNIRNDTIYLSNKLEQWVVWQMLERKLALGSVAGIRLPQYGMSITRDNLAAIQR
jgi:hypothetical protein